MTESPGGTTRTEERPGRIDAGPVRLMTLSPELPGAERLIDRLLDRGVAVSLDQRDATAVKANPSVPESQRYCSKCGEAVGRGRDGQPGRTEGFCPRDGTDLV